MVLKNFHRYLFLLGTAGIVIGLPLWPYLLSVSQLLLALNWVAELNFKEKFHKILIRKSIILLSSIYIIHIIGLLNTHNFAYAWNDIKIKLPLLVLPIIYGTTEAFSKKELKTLLILFISSMLASSFVSTAVILGFTKIVLVDSRYSSIIIHHIRFSLLLVLTIYILYYLLLFNDIVLVKWEKIVAILAITWFIFFLFLLNAFTGIVIFLILLPLSIIWWTFWMKKRILLKISYALTFVFFGSLFFYFLYSYHRFNYKDKINPAELPTHTINGNSYINLLNDSSYENGHQASICFCEKELRKEWNKRSRFNYDSLDRKKQPIHTTLLRYITSMGYCKDSVGISKLNRKDIDMIERGYTNYLYKYRLSLYPRLYEIFWQFEMFKKNNNPSGQSLMQRIVFFKTGLKISHHFFWFGVGTGDLQEAFDNQYVIDKSPLPESLRLRAHNQFLTFLITFGIFGFLWIFFALFYSPFLEKRYSFFPFIIFFLIVVLSMLDDDTLETQAGVTIFAFFYVFILYSWPMNKLSNDKQA